MPLFFSLNHLHCDGIPATIAFFDGSGSARLKHARSISIDLTEFHTAHESDLRRLPEAFKAFQRAEVSLKTLELAVNDEEWLKMRPTERTALGRKTQISKFEQLPIFSTLVQICARAETLKFKGNCEKLERCMRQHMAQVTSAAPSPSAGASGKRRSTRAAKSGQGRT